MLDQALTLIIPSGATRDMNDSDVANLVNTYAVVEIAKDDFLAQKISFDEYMMILESAQVNVDSYMANLEHNLETVKLI